MYTFAQLAYVTRLGNSDTRHFNQVSEWDAKRQTLVVQLADIPILSAAHMARKETPYPGDSRMSVVDMTPTIRLSNSCEATANCLYSVAEIASNFGNKASKGALPSSFNALRKKCEAGALPAVSAALGDLQWYRKVRELRTEWTHYSSIFIAQNDIGLPIICVRAYRRESDKVEFPSPKFSCSVDEFIGWVRNALVTLDCFAAYLLKEHVIPSLPLDQTFYSPVCDKNGFPIVKADSRIEVETISVREYLRRGGINVEG